MKGAAALVKYTARQQTRKAAGGRTGERRGKLIESERDWAHEGDIRIGLTTLRTAQNRLLAK